MCNVKALFRTDSGDGGTVEAKAGSRSRAEGRPRASQVGTPPMRAHGSKREAVSSSFTHPENSPVSLHVG